jgi:hypothetical protein
MPPELDSKLETLMRESERLLSYSQDLRDELAFWSEWLRAWRRYLATVPVVPLAMLT